MRVAVFDTHSYDRAALEAANARFGHELVFFEPRLDHDTAVLARGFEAVCSFVNDRLDAAALSVLAAGGTRIIALRSAGYNHVDLVKAESHAITVVRVPEYSPFAVAEHTFALLLALIRKIPRAVSRVREANFSLEHLVGFDLAKKVFGVVGTGRIGATVARIALGFSCEVVAFDASPRADLIALGVRYEPLDRLLASADVISLHVPLTPTTRHIIDGAALARMKPGAILLNTGRGALVDARALIEALKRGRLGGAALDVYEEEEGIFFRDLSDQALQDDVLARLLTFPNVLITAHQAFLTREALGAIADTTLGNIRAFERGEPLVNQVRAQDVLRSH